MVLTFSHDNTIIDDEENSFSEDPNLLIRKFRSSISNREVIIHKHQQSNPEQIIEQSAFAQLAIMPTSFVHMLASVDRDLIFSHLYCPILLIDHDFSIPDQLIFTYDHHHSSVSAIKQFCQLFPGLNQAQVTILYMRCDSEAELAGEIFLLQMLQDYFKDIGIDRINAKAIENSLEVILESNHTAILTLSNQGRPKIGQFFNPDTGFKILTQYKLPLFIAHH